MFIKFIVPILFTSSPVWAVDELIAVSTTATPKAEFELAVKAQGAISWTDNFGLSRPSMAYASQLRHLVVQAQRSFLEGDTSSAEIKFREITELASADDWGAAQREAIFHSFLRVYQLQTNLSTKIETMQKAIGFAPDLSPDDSVFPPPLVEQWRGTRSKMAKEVLRVSVSEKLKKYERIYINGNEISLVDSDLLEIWPGTHRFTMTSNVYRPVTKKIVFTEFQKVEWNSSTFLEGNCELPKAESRTSDESWLAVYEGRCLWTLTGALVKRISDSPDFGSASFDKTKFSHAASLNATSDFKEPKAIQPSRRWIWVAAAGAALVSGYLIYQNRQRNENGAPPKEEIVPSHRTGY